MEELEGELEPKSEVLVFELELALEPKVEVLVLALGLELELALEPKLEELELVLVSTVGEDEFEEEENGQVQRHLYDFGGFR